MILVLLSNGDSAEADTAEEAVYAATCILREASENGTYYSSPTAAFYGADGMLVRQGVSLADLTSAGAA